MSFRVQRDFFADSATIRQNQKIPLMESNPQTGAGTIEFNTTLDTFYGLSNRIAVPLSTGVVTTIPVGVTPAGIAITPNGTKAYVANNNNYAAQYEPSTNCDSVSVISLSTFTVIKTITDTSFNQPYTVTISPDGTKAYVTNSNGTTITIINTATDTVMGTITGFNGPSGMVINSTGTTGYVNNYGSPGGGGSGSGTTVSVVNLLSNTVTATVTVDLAPAALAISPDNKYVYTVNYKTGSTDGTISVITTSNNTSIISAMTGLSGPFGIALNPAGTVAYVTNFGSNNFSPFGTTLSVISLATPTAPVITNTITLGIQPSGVAVSPDGMTVYVSNYNTLYSDNTHSTGLTPGQGIVNLINASTLQVLPINIPVDQSPSLIAIAPNGKFGLVSNFTSNTVSVIAML